MAKSDSTFNFKSQGGGEIESIGKLRASFGAETAVVKGQKRGSASKLTRLGLDPPISGRGFASSQMSDTCLSLWFAHLVSFLLQEVF